MHSESVDFIAGGHLHYNQIKFCIDSCLMGDHAESQFSGPYLNHITAARRHPLIFPFLSLPLGLNGNTWKVTHHTFN